MELTVKNMVCPRCVMAVTAVLQKHAFPVHEVSLGKIRLEVELSEEELQVLGRDLEELGFELLDNPRAMLVNMVKSAVVNEVHHVAEKPGSMNYSDFLSNKTGIPYDQLSHLFSAVEGITIEKFIILQKIEKVKELIAYGQLSLSEIAWKLGYSSVAHLSAQFKKVTGLTPTAFKSLGPGRLKGIDQVGRE